MDKEMQNISIDIDCSAYQLNGIHKQQTRKALCYACNINMTTVSMNVGSSMINLCDECKQKLLNILEGKE